MVTIQAIVLVIGCTTIVNSSIEHATTSSEKVKCSLWSRYNKTEKTCGCIRLHGDPLKCDEFAIEGTIPNVYILDCYCATYDDEIDLVDIGQCQFNSARYRNSHDTRLVYNKLPSNTSVWNSYMCREFHRDGALCGKCDENNNFYPRAYSFNVSCVHCNNSLLSNFWKYISIAYVPLTGFNFLIFFLKVDIHSSHLQGFIFFSQFITVSPLAQRILLVSRNKPGINIMTQLLGTFFGVWNLDFFRTYDNNICFYLSNLSILSLDLCIAAYPMVLMFITYIAIHLYSSNYKLFLYFGNPFKSLYKNWSVKTSLINAFSAFLFLTTTKFLVICSEFLIPVKVFKLGHSDEVRTEWKLFYDSTTSYFGPEHQVYVFLAVIIIFTFISLPVAGFLLYSMPCCQKCLSSLPPRCQLFLHTFVDSFEGCYKDGTEPGTRDCRWYASVLYRSRPALLVVYAITANPTFVPLAAIILTLFAMLTIIVDPFKKSLNHLSPAVSTYIIFVAVFYVSSMGADIAVNNNISLDTVFFVITSVISLIPIFYVAALTTQWIYNVLFFRRFTQAKKISD